MKRILFVLLLLVMLVPIVSAVKPSLVPTTLDTGCLIESPRFLTYYSNTNTQFNFHVINISNGLPLNISKDGMYCLFHLYNQTGKHVFENYSLSMQDKYDYYVDVNAGNMTGNTLSYIVQCIIENKIGCFDSEAIVLTSDGRPTTQNDIGIPIILVFMFLASILIVIIIITSINWLKLFLVMPLSIIVVALLRMLSIFTSLNYPTQTGLIGILDTFYRLCTIGIYPFVGICMLATVILVINAIKQSINKKGNGGLEPFNIQ